MIRNPATSFPAGCGVFFMPENSARLMAKNSLNRNGDDWNDDDDVDDVVGKAVGAGVVV
jgi:hypothetical protein